MSSSSFANLRCPAALARFFLTCAVGLTLDLYSKVYAAKHLLIVPLVNDGDGKTVAFSDEYKFIPGWLHFHFTVNHGAVFGIGQGQRGLFIGVSIAAILFLTYLFAASGRQRFYQMLLGLLLAGVLGNMYDRIVFGYVRDMVYALPGWKWPEGIITFVHHFAPNAPRDVFPWIFNVADSMLCVGVFLMMVYTSWPRRRESAQTEHPSIGELAQPPRA